MKRGEKKESVSSRYVHLDDHERRSSNYILKARKQGKKSRRPEKGAEGGRWLASLRTEEELNQSSLLAPRCPCYSLTVGGKDRGNRGEGKHPRVRRDEKEKNKRGCVNAGSDAKK